MLKGIQVTYACVDGAHFFTSEDPVAVGLCVAHTDLKKAFEEVNHQLKILLKKNHNIDAEIEAAVSFLEFRAWLNEEKRSRIKAIQATPGCDVSWKYEEKKAA